MSASLELLDRDCILAGLTDAARALLSRLEVHAVLDSTNRYLLAGAQAGWPSGVVCLAEQQTAGRGRQGRHWLTPSGASLACSLLWRFAVHPAALSGLSLAAGIAVARALQNVGVTEVGLKWPNDVWWHQRKLGGILLESDGVFGDFYVVAGIGINVALPRQEAAVIDQPWVDLQEIRVDESISRNALAAFLISELLETFLRFEQGGFADLAMEWANFDQVKGCQVSLCLPNATVTGVARGVDATGALLLETASGEIKPYIGGEISLRIAA
ncbi:MAG: biotin--[acetyl-CoA-carboxylase] ligase [Candidatus Competibacteraceae bacterium]|nr:biotin--[acetyl-CoA-carboxylase] ligase [Candidatus Competibacteraceae bacterium]